MELKIARGAADFALALYAQLAARPGNLLFSPYSIRTALAMVYAGARQRTAEQIAEALRFEAPPDSLHEALAPERAEIRADAERTGVDLNLADAVWVQTGFPIHASYARILEGGYAAPLRPVDFRNEPLARRAINHWVEQETRERIRDLVPPGVLDATTRLVLADAVYFKGLWMEPFPAEQTRPKEFWIAGRDKVQVPMMMSGGTFPYAKAHGVACLAMSYQHGGFEMIVLLPEERGGLDRIGRELDGERLTGLLRALRPTHVYVELPRFRLDHSLALIPILQALGVADAFSYSAADLSGIAGERLFISAAMHKAWAAVDEKGTEAAAVTAVGAILSAAGWRPPPPPVPFIADHPFLFLLRHVASGQILFMGRVDDPR